MIQLSLGLELDLIVLYKVKEDNHICKETRNGPGYFNFNFTKLTGPKNVLYFIELGLDKSTQL